MNIRQHIDIEKLAAGGPGSGRHASETHAVLEKHGWKQEGYHFKYGTSWRHSSVPNHYVMVDPHKANWRYFDRGSKLAQGRSSESLEQHLTSKSS